MRGERYSPTSKCWCSFAKFLQVQKSTLSEWLRDKNEPPMGMIVKIALYLNVSTDYLLGLESEAGGRMV